MIKFFISNFEVLATHPSQYGEVINWVETGRILEKAETRGKSRAVLVARSMFDPETFKLRVGVLMFTKAVNQNQTGDVWRICLPQ